VMDKIASEIGPIAKPGRVWIVPDMPKTRSGKIMRRVLSAVANRQDTGDVTTLANPEVVEKISSSPDRGEPLLQAGPARPGLPFICRHGSGRGSPRMVLLRLGIYVSSHH